MKKKIVQWLIGLFFSIFGYYVCVCGVSAVYNFIGMMNSTGREFIGHFFCFIFMLSIFLLLPYLFFWELQDGVQDKWK